MTDEMGSVPRCPLEPLVEALAEEDEANRELHSLGAVGLEGADALEVMTAAVSLVTKVVFVDEDGPVAAAVDVVVPGITEDGISAGGFSTSAVAILARPLTPPA